MQELLSPRRLRSNLTGIRNSQINQQKQKKGRQHCPDTVSNPELQQLSDLIEKAKNLGVALDVRFTDRRKELVVGSNGLLAKEYPKTTAGG